jgi:predicted DNA-binding transcriptional regulator AlpA
MEGGAVAPPFFYGSRRCRPERDQAMIRTRPTSKKTNIHRPFLSIDEAALYLGVSPSFLNKRRGNLSSPPHIKLGRRVMYARADLDAWIDTCRHM